MYASEPHLSKIEEDGWELEDGEDRHRENPHTFWIPPSDIRQNLVPGTIVKLIFRIRTKAENGRQEETVERMWVAVKSKVGEYYIGELDDDARCTDEIKAGLKVVFQPKHVIQIYRLLKLFPNDAAEH